MKIEMKCVNACGECPYISRCGKETIKPKTLFEHKCKDYFDALTLMGNGGCFKYNPILVHCRNLAMSTFQAKMNAERASGLIENYEDADKAFEIFKRLLDCSVGLETGTLKQNVR